MPYVVKDFAYPPSLTNLQGPVWYDGAYCYVANCVDPTQLSKINAYAVSSNNLTFAGTVTTGFGGIYPQYLWGDGTYIYVSHGDQTNNPMSIDAYTFDGSTFTHRGGFSSSGSVNPYTQLAGGIGGDGTHVYWLAKYVPSLAAPASVTYLNAYRWVGGTLTNVGSTTFGTYTPGGVIVQNGSVYVALSGYSVQKLSFDGISFTVLNTAINANVTGTIIGNGIHIFVAHSNSTSIFVYDQNLNPITTFNENLSNINGLYFG